MTRMCRPWWLRVATVVPVTLAVICLNGDWSAVAHPVSTLIVKSDETCPPNLNLAESSESFIKSLRPGIDLTVSTLRQPLSPEATSRFPVAVVHYRWDNPQVRLETLLPGLPAPQPRPWLAAPSDSVSIINGDYFRSWGGGWHVPNAAVVHRSRPVFAPPGWSRVLVSAHGERIRTTRVRYRSTLTSGGRSLRASALNDPLVPRHVNVVFDAQWTLPVNLKDRWGVVLVNDVIYQVSPPGHRIRPPRESRVFTTTSARAARGFRVGARANLQWKLDVMDTMPLESASGHGGYVLHRGKLKPLCNEYENVARPRTVVAWNSSGDAWLLVAGPGQPDRPDGLRVGGATKRQLAGVASDLGATEAVSLDGGGSSLLMARTSGEWRRFDNRAGAWLRPFPVGWSLNFR